MKVLYNYAVVMLFWGTGLAAQDEPITMRVEQVALKPAGRVDSVVLVFNTENYGYIQKEGLRLYRGSRLEIPGSMKQNLLLDNLLPFNGADTCVQKGRDEHGAYLNVLPGPGVPKYLRFSARCGSEGAKAPDKGDVYHLRDTIIFKMDLASPDENDRSVSIHDRFRTGDATRLNLNTCFDGGSIEDAVLRSIRGVYWINEKVSLKPQVLRISNDHGLGSSGWSFEGYTMEFSLLETNETDLTVTILRIPERDRPSVDIAGNYVPAGPAFCLRLTAEFSMSPTFPRAFSQKHPGVTANGGLKAKPIPRCCVSR